MPWVVPVMLLDFTACFCRATAVCAYVRHTEWDEAEHTPCQCDREWVFQSKRSAPSSLPSLSLSLCSSSFFSGSTDTLSLSSSALPPPRPLSFLQQWMLSLSQHLSLHPSLPAAFIVWMEGWRRMNEGWWIGWVCLAWPLVLQEPLQCCKPLLTHTQSISHAPFLSSLSFFSGILLVKNHLWMSRSEWVNRFVILQAADVTHLQKERMEDNEGRINILSYSLSFWVSRKYCISGGWHISKKASRWRHFW